MQIGSQSIQSYCTVWGGCQVPQVPPAQIEYLFQMEWVFSWYSKLRLTECTVQYTHNTSAHSINIPTWCLRWVSASTQTHPACTIAYANKYMWELCGWRKNNSENKGKVCYWFVHCQVTWLISCKFSQIKISQFRIRVSQCRSPPKSKLICAVTRTDRLSARFAVLVRYLRRMLWPSYELDPVWLLIRFCALPQCPNVPSIKQIR